VTQNQNRTRNNTHKTSTHTYKERETERPRDQKLEYFDEYTQIYMLREKEERETREMRINIQITSDCHHRKITENSESIQRTEKWDSFTQYQIK